MNDMCYIVFLVTDGHPEVKAVSPNIDWVRTIIEEDIDRFIGDRCMNQYDIDRTNPVKITISAGVKAIHTYYIIDTCAAQIHYRNHGWLNYSTLFAVVTFGPITETIGITGIYDDYRDAKSAIAQLVSDSKRVGYPCKYTVSRMDMYNDRGGYLNTTKIICLSSQSTAYEHKAMDDFTARAVEYSKTNPAIVYPHKYEQQPCAN